MVTRKRKPGRPPKYDPSQSEEKVTEKRAGRKRKIEVQENREEDEHDDDTDEHDVHPVDDNHHSIQYDDDDEEEDDDDGKSGGYDTDPETIFDITNNHNVNNIKVSTIHWDVIESKRIGWKIRILGIERDGRLFQYDKKLGFELNARILQYDPYSHKHKIEFMKSKKCIWLRLRCTSAQIATRLVWAHVRGYPWWPAMVLESDDADINPKDGYVFVEFIGSPEVATLRDSLDCIRPFTKEQDDPVIRKCKKKRNTRSINFAFEEQLLIQQIRNKASKLYARKAFTLCNIVAPGNVNYMGKRIKIFRDDINYPYGDTIIGHVRKYSTYQKKWLLNYEVSSKTKKKYCPSWINLHSKQCTVIEILDNDSNTKQQQQKSSKQKGGRKKKEEELPSDIDILPFLYDFKWRADLVVNNNNNGGSTSSKKKKKRKGPGCIIPSRSLSKSKPTDSSDEYIWKLLSERCLGCADIWRDGTNDKNNNNHKITCNECSGTYHLSCVDPPISNDQRQQMLKDSKKSSKRDGADKNADDDNNGDDDEDIITTWKCPKCTICRGCYQKDIVFGSHPQPIPPTLSFPANESLDLCSVCVKMYEKQKYCPNCAHVWDEVKYHKVVKQLQKDAKKGILALPSRNRHNIHQMNNQMNGIINGINVDPSVYFAESFVWGYTEDDMLVCDGCDLWVHAGCANLTEDEYNLTSNGEHPIYNKEFLCRMCCRKRCKNIIEALQKEDSNMMIFAVPVTEQMAPNYRDVIKEPMDLQTMMHRAENEEYTNYAWVRESFELMVYNALAFNRYFTVCWNEAKRYYNDCIKNVFDKIGKAAPPSKIDVAIQKHFEKAEEARKLEETRLVQDESTEKKDLVAGTEVAASITLPPLRTSLPDESSCLPYKEIRIKPVDAFYCAWMDCCFTCGSSGAADTMMFCVDCGEAFHSFCANVPIHSMDASSVAGWRCPNCKICEISGDAPKDELRMLFCEMCDRGFSLDLLDPPLKKAPSGLWICGQCVNCKSCNNTAEPNGKNSLKYWSCDPEKCYRCGGCKGIVKFEKSMKCVVCAKVLRKTDDDVESCGECELKVHVSCDFRANEHRINRTEGSRSKKKQKAMTLSYRCPCCISKNEKGSVTQGINSTTKAKGSGSPPSKADQELRKHLHEQAWYVISNGLIQSNGKTSQLELHTKLMEEVDWKTREIWKEEYIIIINEGIRLFKKARASIYGDPRLLVQRIYDRKFEIPAWMHQRACRFVCLTKKYKWDQLCYSSEKRINNCVLIAKLAASFLEIYCRVMEVNAKKSVKCYSRVTNLLKNPHECGHFEVPTDVIRSRKHKGIIDDKEIQNIIDEQFLDKAQCSDLDGTSREENLTTNGDEPVEIEEEEEPEEEKYKVASPLCGWDHLADMANSDNVWKDPRECCLCHLCGDDDAGFEDNGKYAERSSVAAVAEDEESAEGTNSSAEKVKIVSLGRLLPMSEGLWAHACCAMWSSEVWEASSGGLVNCVEKARSRGAQLKCFGCGRPGATVGCNKTHCVYNYHFPCAKFCGGGFTSDRRFFCSSHTSLVSNLLKKESFEIMKTLIVTPEKNKPIVDKDKVEVDDENAMCTRVGCFIVHSLGTIEQSHDGFHSENYIFPVGYFATRIFWSTRTPRSRTVYILRIQKSSGGSNNDKPVFTITPGDDPSSVICSPTIAHAYCSLMDRVKKVNDEYFSQGDLFSKLPTVRKTRKKIFGLNGAQFFGIGLNFVRKMLENSPGIEAVVAPLNESSPRYLFCYNQPKVESIVALQRKRAAFAAERALENSTGCARTEGRVAVTRSGGSGRITRALVRNVEVEEEEVVPVKNDPSSKGGVPSGDKKASHVKYQKYKSVPIEQRLVAKRSHIHGWGLFTKIDIEKDDMIVEYMGEIIRRCIADKREKEYEISGEGSCYMFRLDLQRIVDATVIGCMARFMNHCCQPNAYAKVIHVNDAETSYPDKKIAVFAIRDISAGEEITYDYKFPVEDGSLRCTCGAPNCIGRMN